ncbi:MAG: zinc ribbon domain-containing protein [Lentisphaeria bacterium]|nr:zinc ribbon domain-containing protein [Lentisphaeria bacterium]
MNNFVCSQCKTEFEVPYKFCKECGGIVEEKQITSNRFCPQCGKEMQSGAQFCSFCGGKAKGSSKKGFLIFLAILIVLGAAGGVGYKFYCNRSTSDSNSARRAKILRHIKNKYSKQAYIGPFQCHYVRTSVKLNKFETESSTTISYNGDVEYKCAKHDFQCRMSKRSHLHTETISSRFSVTYWKETGKLEYDFDTHNLNH